MEMRNQLSECVKPALRLLQCPLVKVLKQMPNRLFKNTQIFAVFKALVEACLVLQQGRRHALQRGWNPIVDRDISLNNAVLDDSSVVGEGAD